MKIIDAYELDKKIEKSLRALCELQESVLIL